MSSRRRRLVVVSLFTATVLVVGVASEPGSAMAWGVVRVLLRVVASGRPRARDPRVVIRGSVCSAAGPGIRPYGPHDVERSSASVFHRAGSPSFLLVIIFCR